MNIRYAENDTDIEIIRKLFVEYAESLGYNLCFQGFNEELKTLPGKYSAPEGILLLAEVSGRIAGCVALRKIGEGICEMKRLYVKPQFRGLGLGKALAVRIIDEGKKLDYKIMRLDTLDILEKAIQIYQQLGFRKVSPYYDNPLPGVTYWELELKNSVLTKI